MRPGTLDLSQQLKDEIFQCLVEKANAGQPVRYVRDRNADRNLKQAIMPKSTLDKSIICRHVKLLRDEGLVDVVIVGYDKTVVHGHVVAYEIVELNPH